MIDKSRSVSYPSEKRYGTATPKPFIPPKLPLENIAWDTLLPSIVKANVALAKFDGLLENIQNPLIFLAPLLTQEAVLSSRS